MRKRGGLGKELARGSLRRREPEAARVLPAVAQTTHPSTKILRIMLSH